MQSRVFNRVSVQLINWSLWIRFVLYIIFHFSAQMHSVHTPSIQSIYWDSKKIPVGFFFLIYHRAWQLSLSRMESRKSNLFYYSNLVTDAVVLISIIMMPKCQVFSALCYSVPTCAASVISRTHNLTLPWKLNYYFSPQPFNKTNNPLFPSEFSAKFGLCHLT